MIKWEQEGSPPCRTSSACHMWKLLSWRFYENPTAFLLECRILCQRMWCSVATSSPRTLSSCLLWSPSCLISRSGPILKPFALRGFWTMTENVCCRMSSLGKCLFVGKRLKNLDVKDMRGSESDIHWLMFHTVRPQFILGSALPFV